MIYVRPQDSAVWFLRNQADLATCKRKVASDKVDIWIYNDGGQPCIEVTRNGQITDQFKVVQVSMLEFALSEEYKSYHIGDQETPIVEINLEILEREEELDLAVSEFLDVVLGGDGMYTDEVIKDCKEVFVKYIADTYDCDVFRPMYVEREDGEAVFFNFPYSES